MVVPLLVAEVLLLAVLVVVLVVIFCFYLYYGTRQSCGFTFGRTTRKGKRMLKKVKSKAKPVIGSELFMKKDGQRREQSETITTLTSVCGGKN